MLLPLAPIPDFGRRALGGHFMQDSITHVGMHDPRVPPPGAAPLSCSHPSPCGPCSPTIGDYTPGVNESSWNQGLLLLKKAASHFLVDNSSKNFSILLLDFLAGVTLLTTPPWPQMGPGMQVWLAFLPPLLDAASPSVHFCRFICTCLDASSLLPKVRDFFESK